MNNKEDKWMVMKDGETDRKRKREKNRGKKGRE